MQQVNQQQRQQEVRENVRSILQQVRQTALEAGRDPQQVQVMAVTKTVAPELVNAAIAEGITLLGENKAQKVCMIESVDSVKLAREIERQCANIGKVMDVLVEVNIGAEESKSGVSPEQLPALLQEIGQFEHIRVRGLMTIPPVCEDEQQVSQYFSQMSQLFIDIKQKKYDNINMEILSMGMSADYPIAVQQGSNIVRIGTAMFGQRNYKRS